MSRPSTTRPAPRRTGSRLAATAASAVVVALAAPAVAGAEWRDLGDAYSGLVSTPSFSLAPNGDMAVGVGAYRTGCCSPGYQVAHTVFQRLGGGTFEKTAPLDGGAIAEEEAHVVHAADGTLHAWWNGSAKATPGIATTHLRADGTWAPVDVLPVSRQADERLGAAFAAAVDGQGRLTVLVHGGPGTVGEFGVSAITHDASGWGPTRVLSAGYPREPKLLTGRDGLLRAVWAEPGTDLENGTTETLVAQTRAADGSWSAPVRSSALVQMPRAFVGALDVALAGNGDLVAAYTRVGLRSTGDTSSENVYAVVTTRVRKGAKTWDAQRTLAPEAFDRNRGPVRVAALDDGRAVVAWLGSDADPREGSPAAALFGSVVRRGAAPSTPRTIDEPAARSPFRTGDFTLATNRAQGVVTAAWKTTSGQWAIRDWKSWDGTWAPISDVPAPIVSPTDLIHVSRVEMNIDALGDTVLDGRGAGVGVVEAANRKLAVVVDDFSGPRVSDVAGPRTAKAGVSGTFSVTAKDAFSGLGGTTWDFGDGTTATGNSVAHAWAKAGRYAVTATATDQWGHASAVSSTVVVSADGTTKAAASVAAPGATGSRAAGTGHGRTVRISRIGATPGWIRLRSTGPADLTVRVERRLRKHVFRPVATVGVRVGSASTVRVRSKAVSAGIYKVTVEPAPGAEGTVRPATWVGRAAAAKR